jgi:hypothetical protein
MTSRGLKNRIAIALSMIILGCSRVDVDLSNDSEYMNEIGKYYRTKIDLGLYTPEGEKKTRALPFGSSDLPPRDEIGEKFPFKYQGDNILGILPARSEFKTVRVIQENVKASGFIEYYVEITKSPDPQWVGKVVNPMGITTYDLVPKFEPKYVEEITE